MIAIKEDPNLDLNPSSSLTLKRDELKVTKCKFSWFFLFVVSLTETMTIGILLTKRTLILEEWYGSGFKGTGHGT